MDTVGYAYNIRLKEIKKRRALFSHRTFVLYNYFCRNAKQLCNYSLLFFTSLIPSSLCATVGLHCSNKRMEKKQATLHGRQSLFGYPFCKKKREATLAHNLTLLLPHSSFYPTAQITFSIKFI